VSGNPRWQRLLWWTLGLDVPTLWHNELRPTLRWAWTGRMEARPDLRRPPRTGGAKQ
jgi:hypothetical protein